MASVRPRKNKQGEIVSYEIRVSRGYDPITRKALKPYTMTYTPPEGWSAKAIERELSKTAGDFQAACDRGEVLTKEQQREQEKERREHEAAEKLNEERRPTFTKYIETFLQEKQITFSPGTMENYSIALHRAAAVFGDLRMVDIDFLTVKKYLSTLQEPGANTFNGEPMAIKSVIKHYIVLRSIFENAVENKIISVSPMAGMKRPKPRKDEIQKPAKSYTADETKYIMKCLDNEPLKWRAMIRLAIDSGLRRGELVGLRWEDIDFKTGEITVCHNAQYTNGKGTYITSPKNGKVRSFPLNPPALAIMQEWRKAQAVLLMGQGLPRLGFCFTQENGQMMNPQAPTAYCSRFGKRYGIEDFHPHALRHTMGSLSVANGGDIYSISKKLGHSDAAITLQVYTHENEEAKKRTNAALADAIYTDQK